MYNEEDITQVTGLLVVYLEYTVYNIWFIDKRVRKRKTKLSLPNIENLY